MGGTDRSMHVAGFFFFDDILLLSADIRDRVAKLSHVFGPQISDRIL